MSLPGRLDTPASGLEVVTVLVYCCFTGLISKSSSELLELLELWTGELEPSLAREAKPDPPSEGNRPPAAENLLDDLLVRPESSLGRRTSFSFPFNDAPLLAAPAMSIER